jgi:hypothetical protein
VGDFDARLVTREDLDRGLNDVRREFATFKSDVFDRCYEELTEKVDHLTSDFRSSAEALTRIELQGRLSAQSAATAAEASEKLRTNKYTKYALAAAASSPIVAVLLHFVPK